MPAAARKTDLHTCPKVEPGPLPHVGGPVLQPCADAVTVGYLASARIGDMLVCIGPPDTIKQGSPTVIIEGLPASRITDQTVHGGVIVDGEGSVLIGNGTSVVNGKSVSLKNMTIVIEGDDAFIADTRAALAILLPTRSGVKWLAQMGIGGRAITIRSPALAAGQAINSAKAQSGADSVNGVGTDTTIVWDPDVDILDLGLPGTQGTPGAHVILAHEMVHAEHNANGENLNGPRDTFPGQKGSSSRNEERGTVGTSGYTLDANGNKIGSVRLPDGSYEQNPRDYGQDVPTENSFREDLGIDERPNYYPSNWPGGPPW